MKKPAAGEGRAREDAPGLAQGLVALAGAAELRLDLADDLE